MFNAVAVTTCFPPQSGDIAQHLEFVSHRVRSQLDELKRKEIERLNTVKKLMNIKAEVAADRQRDGADSSLKFKHMPDISRRMADSLLKIQGRHVTTVAAWQTRCSRYKVGTSPQSPHGRLVAQDTR